MRTSINGKLAPWPSEVAALWHTHVERADPKMYTDTGQIMDANYFTPRPYVDEYNRGSHEAGFTYTVKHPHGYAVPRVYQCSWPEAYSPEAHDKYRGLP